MYQSRQNGKRGERNGHPWMKGDRMKRTGIPVESRIVTPSPSLKSTSANYRPFTSTPIQGGFVFYFVVGPVSQIATVVFVSPRPQVPKGGPKIGRWFVSLCPVCSAIRLNHLQGMSARNCAHIFFRQNRCEGKSSLTCSPPSLA